MLITTSNLYMSYLNSGVAIVTTLNIVFDLGIHQNSTLEDDVEVQFESIN